MAKSVYLTAALSACAILVLVLFSISLTESSRVNELNDEIKQISLEAQLQSAYADFDSNNSEVYCLVISQGIESLSERASKLDKKLRNYEDSAFNTQEFYMTKRSFLITNMLLLRNLQKAKSSCGLETKTVLFFYAEDRSCEVDCGVIGSQLEQLSAECHSFRYFNFPYDWPSYEFTKILEVKYGVKKTATLVIDGERFDSPLALGDLKEKLGCE